MPKSVSADMILNRLSGILSKETLRIAARDENYARTVNDQ
jgi:hypothetical protein